MKAVVCTKSGSPDVLKLREIKKPVPKDHEVLVKVYAATVTRGDVVLRKLHPLLFLPLRLFGVRRKTIPGHEFAGEVEMIGKHVTQFKPGDQVFGTTTGLGVGANAEYVCLPEEWSSGVLARKPANLTYEEAAAVPVGGMTAWYILKHGNIHSEKSVLIYGASGSVGTFAVQLARSLGARVTAVCSSENVELVKSLGADQVIDYTRQDPAQSGQTYHVIFDAVGKTSALGWKNSLKQDGVFLTVQSSTKEKVENLLFLKQLIESDKIRPVIGRRYPLDQAAEAHRYVESGHKVGNVVLVVEHNHQPEQLQATP